MAHLIKSPCPLEANSRLDSAVAESINRPSSTIAQPPCEAAGAAHSDPQVKPDASAQFRTEILRRYEAPFKSARPHDGLGLASGPD